MRMGRECQQNDSLANGYMSPSRRSRTLLPGPGAANVTGRPAGSFMAGGTGAKGGCIRGSRTRGLAFAGSW